MMLASSFQIQKHAQKKTNNRNSAKCFRRPLAASALKNYFIHANFYMCFSKKFGG